MAQVRSVNVECDDSGAFSYTRPFVGQILGIKISGGAALGGAALVIDDPDREFDVLNVSGVNADAWYQPVVIAQDTSGTSVTTTGDVAYAAPVLFGKIRIAVTGATASSSAVIRFLLA